MAKKDGATAEAGEAQEKKEPKRCFFIAPIGTAGSEIRKRSDQVFKHILTPICGELGYHLIRADRIAEAGVITTQVVEHLLNDELVVADLTGRNPNVFYELAIRHVTRKPLIQLMGTGEELPFDVAAMRTVFLDIYDLDSVAAAKDDIADQMRRLSPQQTTPISHALDWHALRQSDDPKDLGFAQLVAAIQELRGEVQLLKRSGGIAFSGSEIQPRSTARQVSGLRRLAAHIAKRYSISLEEAFDAIRELPPGVDVSDASQHVDIEAIVVDRLGLVLAETESNESGPNVDGPES